MYSTFNSEKNQRSAPKGKLAVLPTEQSLLHNKINITLLPSEQQSCKCSSKKRGTGISAEAQPCSDGQGNAGNKENHRVLHLFDSQMHRIVLFVFFC